MSTSEYGPPFPLFPIFPRDDHTYTLPDDDFSSTLPPEFAPNLAPEPIITKSRYSFVKPDERFDSQRIFRLTVLNFKRFVKMHEKTMVLFYNSEKCRCAIIEERFSDMANMSQHEDYGYASVDCATDFPVCVRESGCDTPMYKLYSNGYELSSIKEATGMNVDQMNMLMKMTPVLNDSRGDIGRNHPILDSNDDQPLTMEKEKTGRRAKQFLSGLFKKS